MSEENQAALDDNMPLTEEVETVVDTEVIAESTATPDAEVSGDEPQVIEIDEKQKALNKLAFEKREEKRHNKALEQKIAELEAKIPQAPVQVDSEPTLEQFDYDDQAYNAAMIKHQVKQETQAILKQQEQRESVAAQQRTQAEFNAKVTKLAETAPDYTEVVGQLPELPSDTLGAIMQSDNGPQLAYYLGNHLDVADNIASLPPMQAAIQLGVISSQLANAKPVIKLSAAPEPIEPVNASGSVTKDMDDMTMDEIMAL